jgi:hypothetical protein
MLQRVILKGDKPMEWLSYFYLLRRWAGMIGRCEYLGHPQYHNYGGRGIYVCEEWQDFRNFAMHWKNTFLGTKLQIGRINNDGPYSPENTRPETNKENSQNKRRRRNSAKNIVLDKTYADLSLKWGTMIERCYNPNNKSYHDYGGKGIFVCSEWHDYRNYKAHFHNKIPKGLHIDRIDRNGPYEPSNTRIVTAKQNANNRSTNVKITWNNKTLTIAEWADKTGLNAGTINKRYNLGWQLPDLFRPVSRQATRPREIAHNSDSLRRWNDNGVLKTMTKLSKEYKIPKTTLRYRLVLLGWSLQEALKYETKKLQKVLFQGKLITFAELAKTPKAIATNISASVLQARIVKLGWSIEKAVSTPLLKVNKLNEVNKLYEIAGVKKTLREWSQEPPYIPYKTIFARVNLGWTIENAVSKPINTRNPTSPRNAKSQLI